MTNPCRKCGKAESTGIIFDLCDGCFVEFEAKISEHADKSGSYVPSDKELEYIADPFVVRRD